MNQFLINLYYRYKKGWGFFGDYSTWQAAAADCEGYDSKPILARVLAAARAVKNGEAEFERDGFLFFEKKEIQNLTFWLKKIVDTEGGLRVLDFGGSLASLYFQHRDFLTKLPNTKWCIVEQSHFVDIGKTEFEAENLLFEYTIDEAVKKIKPNIVIISSVLQYLESPFTWLDEIVKYKIPYLWIDRTPFSNREKDWILKQIVDPRVYKATYPAYILSLPKFKGYLEKHYEIVAEFSSPDKINQRECQFLGFFCTLKNT
ncbi:MAG: methyltransferase, TIGR04325 family [Saprospiraceae bacterium]|nr:methyltransferase, TIGR04325 family [Saprospiraceae bacterium]